ncbi:MAG: amino acid transporter [Acidobacteria bacterium]|nr:amino acid transporter [Acidobacteriota bacterium]MBI3424233.1 amino acid transporter [Acidobacteriota bacterium]
MAESTTAVNRAANPLARWLLAGEVKEIEGPHEGEGRHHTHSWWQVMCLTGVDYFSTLGYQPGIAFLAAGVLSPLATLILVLLTLFGALPIYRRVARESPHGEGSISMLEALLPRWRGKLFVLVLLGFVATDFIITITLSAADATEHIVHNPFTPHWLDHPVLVTLVLVGALGAIFLKGFKEAIGLAVVLVVSYLLLNVIVIARGLYEVFVHPQMIPDWTHSLLQHPEVHGNPWLMVGVALILFPKLALGLSGFETGVAVMPLVTGAAGDEQKRPAGRIHNTQKLLLVAALIMSVLLIASSLATTLLIPAKEFQHGGEAFGRALSYLAHHYLGDYFGTIYDLSTISILWFAGASAMAGLLNIVPRYLPRYGMAPDWAKAARPLALVYTAIAFVVTIIFKANVEAQGGAYATGVLVLMSSAALAVTLIARGEGAMRAAFATITLVFLYTTVVNIYERPEGLKIASFFIGAIVIASFISRAMRSTELRVDKVILDETARRYIEELVSAGREIRIVANRREIGDVSEYRFKEQEKRGDNHIPKEDPIIFLEIKIGDASEFSGVMRVRGVQVGDYHVLRTKSPAVPNAIAALLLHIRNGYKTMPHAYFGWTEGSPLTYALKFILFGEGDTAPVTREILRQAEHDPEQRPAIHVGG